MPGLAISALFLTVAFLATACGSSGEASDSEPLTQAELIERADQICERADKAQNAAIEVFLTKYQEAGRSKPPDGESVVKIGLPPIRIEVQELDALVAPVGEEGRIQAILDEVEKAIKMAEDDPSTLLGGDSLGPFAEASRLAREYGFKACAFPL